MICSHKIINKADSLSFPKSVVEYFQGYLGQPPFGFPEELRQKIIRDLPRIDKRPGLTLEPLDLKGTKAILVKKYGERVRDVDVLSYALYPEV